MNWAVFAIATWVGFGLHWGFRDALQLGQTGIAPYVPIVLVVYVGLWAPAASALSAALVVGVAWDLLEGQVTDAGRSVVVLGPHALGCLLAAYTVVTVRGVMLRKNALTLAVLAAVGALLAQLVVVFLLSIRAWYDVVVFGSPLVEFGGRAASSGYTGALALVLAPVLGALRPFFGFRSASGPGFKG